jgi:ankyrin repeat protein
VEALEALNKRNVILEDLLKKDYKGDTPLHTAAKQGNVEILEYFLRSSNKAFIEMQNDFGLTVFEAAKAKYQMLEENKGKTPSKPGLAQYTETDDMKQIEGKTNRLKKIIAVLEKFDDYVRPENWSNRYEISYDEYMKKKADPDMSVFMEYI